MTPPGLIVAAPRSGAGKTTVTLALLAALKRRGVAVQAAKAGPDYIDPRFHEAATIGIPDEKRGETVKSFVVLKPGRTATAEELMAHAGAELARYKEALEVEMMRALKRAFDPRNLMNPGKVLPD